MLNMTDITSNRRIHGHIVLTNGAKPKGRISGHKQARAQIINIKAFAERACCFPEYLTFDHARSVKGLSSFSPAYSPVRFFRRRLGCLERFVGAFLVARRS